MMVPMNMQRQVIIVHWTSNDKKKKSQMTPNSIQEENIDKDLPQAS